MLKFLFVYLIIYYQKFFHVAPLYVCITPVLASVAVQSVQNKVNPVAGLEIASLCVVVIRGGKKPFVVLLISNAADATGVVVPMPTFVLVP